MFRSAVDELFLVIYIYHVVDTHIVDTLCTQKKTRFPVHGYFSLGVLGMVKGGPDNEDKSVSGWSAHDVF